LIHELLSLLEEHLVFAQRARARLTRWWWRRRTGKTPASMDEFLKGFVSFAKFAARNPNEEESHSVEGPVDTAQLRP
jgi:hypothetical protein